MDITDIGIIILLIILLLAGLFFIPRWLTRHAARQVIKIFRENSAIDSKSARTIHELGLNPPGMWERMGRRRDYKPRALSILREAEIIKTTADGRLYLSEDKLANVGLERDTSPYR
jgi:hypothetical protein